MARMAASEGKRRTGGRGEDRKRTPEEIAKERIEAAWKPEVSHLDFRGLAG
jgi:hypothetical protein